MFPLDHQTILLLSFGFIAYSLTAGRLGRTMITAPILFTLFGLAFGSTGLGLIDLSFDHGFVHGLAEFTLIIVLFSDAARISGTKLREDPSLPVRLLLIGMPLIILFGTLTAFQLPFGLTIWEAALVAAILAPTDAALGQPVVENKSVPARIRRGLNVESGLNDGIALPVVLLFAACASIGHAASDDRDWLSFSLLQVTLGPLIGVLIGLVGGKLFNRAQAAGWLNTSAEGAGALGLALACFTGAELAGGNGFMSAFIGGLIFGNTLKSNCEFLFEFAEAEGKALILITFVLFGATLIPEVLSLFTWQVWLYAILSLTLIRGLAVALSLIGTKLDLASILFMGWFGPRGLASILFAVFIIEDREMGAPDMILAIVFATVALSIILHGLTAQPFSQMMGGQMQKRAAQS